MAYRVFISNNSFDQDTHFEWVCHILAVALEVELNYQIITMKDSSPSFVIGVPRSAFIWLRKSSISHFTLASRMFQAEIRRSHESRIPATGLTSTHVRVLEVSLPPGRTRDLGLSYSVFNILSIDSGWGLGSLCYPKRGFSA